MNGTYLREKQKNSRIHVLGYSVNNLQAVFDFKRFTLVVL